MTEQVTVTKRDHMTKEEVIERYPRLVGHMICESLGYFTPASAANAIEHYRQNVPFFCEWYSHRCSIRTKGDYFNEQVVLQVGRDVVREAFQRRRQHSGPMAHYPVAAALVQAEIKGKGPVFMSW